MSTTSSTMIHKHASNKNVMYLAVVMALIFVFFIWNVVQIFINANDDAEYQKATGELRILAQQMASYSAEAKEGKGVAFGELAKARVAAEKQIKLLAKGGDSLPGLATYLPKEVAELDRVWKRMNADALVIDSNKDVISFLHDTANQLSIAVLGLQDNNEKVIDVLLDNNALASQVAAVQRQSWLAERIARSVDKMLEGGEEADKASALFKQDAEEFGSVLAGLLNGNQVLGIRRVGDEEARQLLKDINAEFEFISNSQDEIANSTSVLKNVSSSVDKLAIDAPLLMEQTSELTAKINKLDEQRTFTVLTAIMAIFFIIFLGVVMGALTYMNTRARLGETNSTNDRNQQAILRLLDELADLADGDLTTTATVSEDFTGAIADSINFTIDQLRILVSQINDTALRVSRAAEETQNTALHLAEASEHQAQEIAGASAAVNEMAVTIDQVSTNASESATVAERSVKIANRGAEVVQNTITGMDMIREQIQDTAKRIKRLGESSQEIGDIVSLINDIADQTNILALNAAIQASMAGDAGRGFAVVADEVQRLAERSSAATKQIEALVKTIQSDTNEAVISMEQTTAEVVRGARLAQDAGMALEEIEKVSAELADLIQNISNAARQQAASAGHISNTMNVIQEITQQTNAGTTATAQSIGNLADMATELRSSVAGFTLPNEMASEAI